VRSAACCSATAAKLLPQLQSPCGSPVVAKLLWQFCMQHATLRLLQATGCRLQQAAGCSTVQAASRQATGCILLHAELLQLSHDRTAAWGMQLRPHSNTETGRPVMTHQ